MASSGVGVAQVCKTFSPQIAEELYLAQNIVDMLYAQGLV